MPTAQQTISAALVELMRSESPAIQAKGQLAKRLWEKSAQPGMTPAQLLALADALVDTVDALPGPTPDSASVRIAWKGERPSIPAKPGEVIPDYRAALRGVVTAGFYVGQADENAAYLEEGQDLYDSAPEDQSWAEWAGSWYGWGRDKLSELASPVTERVAAAQQAVADALENLKEKGEEALENLKEKVDDTFTSLKNAAIAIGVTGVLVLAISASAGRGRRR